MPARFYLLSCAAILTSCAGPASGPPVDVTVSWLTERGTIPAEVTGLQYVVMTEGQGDECGSAGGSMTAPRCSLLSTVVSAGAPDPPRALVRDGSHGPQLLVDDLPVGVPLSIELRGFDDPLGTHVVYVGRVGPLVLQPGERRHIALRMYAVGDATAVDPGEMTGRFLSTATALPDGRVLIAGGFDAVTREDCPASLTVESRCFDLAASSEAWLFEPGTGRFHRVAGGMLAARGGHTATLLPDGSVLIAGGATHAKLQLSSVGPSESRALSPVFVPDDADDTPRTFELFDPTLNAELDDIDSDGDPARGGFVGGASDPTTPGALNHGRFMHAAAALPSGARVLLAGGVNAEGQQSWEIFDSEKPGGYGVYYSATNTLPIARTLPSAITSPDGVWIVGGAVASENPDLADVWSPMDGDPNGRVRSAREFTGARYPNPASSSEVPRPQYALARPMLGALDGGNAMVVVGWFGPRCASASPSPSFSLGATDVCSPNGGPSRNHTTLLGGTTMSGITVPTTGVPAMSFGSVAQLDDGSIFMAGGISQSLWRPVTENAVLFEANTMPSTGGASHRGEVPTLNTGRIFAVSAAIPGRGVLTVGGISSNNWDSVTLVPSAEVWHRTR